MPRLTQEQTRELFLAACRAELNALKPGNVHIHAGGHGMETAHFEASAVAAAPWIADRALGVGLRIQNAVAASMATAGVNTNLGILLLSAPLALAAEHTTGDDLRSEVALVLSRLDDADTEAVFAAIRCANPGGLGSAPDQDVARAPTVGLLEAMALATDRDRIAQAYVTDFEEVFDFGLPVFWRARAIAAEETFAVTTLHMAYLAEKLDSHIVRKFGPAAALAVQHEAQGLRPHWDPVAGPQSLPRLLDFDGALKAKGLNPGTTADFVVATLFAAAICDRMAPGGTLSPLVE
jgi:triphosphoribosyl-dephospho-CoA synthase